MREIRLEKSVEGKKKTREILMTHCQQYSSLKIQDIFKFLYQSSFGCEHLVSDLDSVVARIRRESEESCVQNENLLDSLDGDYSRVHLSYLNQGLSVETLGQIFVKSAKNEPDGMRVLENKLHVAEELVREHMIPFSFEDWNATQEEWKKSGYPAIHHSEFFRKTYHPAYRVVSNKFIPFLPLFAKIDKMLKTQSVIVAIEGGSASGKTTLSKMLEEFYDCTVLHMDDFFLRPEQRTPERFTEVGGNVDRERFLKEVLLPLSENKPILYRRFDCATFAFCDPIKIIPKKLTIVEGAYSMHPELASYYDLSVFLDIDSELQKKRIERRNSPEMAKRFFEEWIPLEKIYFSKMEVEQRCDISIASENN